MQFALQKCRNETFNTCSPDCDPSDKGLPAPQKGICQTGESEEALQSGTKIFSFAGQMHDLPNKNGIEAAHFGAHAFLGKTSEKLFQLDALGFFGWLPIFVCFLQAFCEMYDRKIIKHTLKCAIIQRSSCTRRMFCCCVLL